jgi:hypothetical protein
MKKFLIVTILFIISINDIYSQPKEFGLGIILGSPSGFSGKYWMTEYTALDFGMGYSFSGKNNMTNFHADYLWHNDNVIKVEAKIPLYYGVGARLKIRQNSASRLGVRGALGITYFPTEIPIDLFFEVVPVFNLVPSTELDIETGLGFRYYFR